MQFLKLRHLRNVGLLAIALLVSLIAATLVSGAPAGGVDFAVLAGGNIPVGDFGRKTDIVAPIADGTYSARGGGARSGFGIRVDAEAEVRPGIFVGGELGYLRNGADASELQSLEPDLEEIDAAWGIIHVGAFTRMIVYHTPAFDLYLRAGAGIANVDNHFDATVYVPFAPARLESSFDLGNHFFVNVGAGGDYRISQRVSLVAAFGFMDVFTDGARATVSRLGLDLTGTQEFDIQSLEIMAGVRFSPGPW